MSTSVRLSAALIALQLFLPVFANAERPWLRAPRVLRSSRVATRPRQASPIPRLTGTGAIAHATSIAIERALREELQGYSPSAEEMRTVELVQTETNADATTTATFAIHARGRTLRVAHRFHSDESDAAAVSALVVRGLREPRQETQRTYVFRNGRPFRLRTQNPQDFFTGQVPVPPLGPSSAADAILGPQTSRVRVAFERLIQSGRISFSDGVVSLQDGAISASAGEREAIPLTANDARERLTRIDHGSAPNSVGPLLLDAAELATLTTALQEAPSDIPTVQSISRSVLSMLGWHPRQRALRVDVRHRTWVTVAPGRNFGRAVTHHSIDLMGTVTHAQSGAPTTFALSFALPAGSENAAAVSLAVARQVALHR